MFQLPILAEFLACLRNRNPNDFIEILNKQIHQVYGIQSHSEFSHFTEISLFADFLTHTDLKQLTQFSSDISHSFAKLKRKFKENFNRI